MRSILLLSSGSTLYFAASIQKRSCSFTELLWVLRRKVVAFAEVFVHVVKFPFVIIHVDGFAHLPWCERRRGAGDPAIVVDCAVGGHLEILGTTFRSRCCVVERIDQAGAFDRLLWYPVEHRGRLQAEGFKDGWSDVDDVMELRADGSLILDPHRPRHDHAIACATEVRRDLLGPLERRVQAARPAYGIAVERERTAQIIHARHDLLKVFRYSIEEGHLVEQSLLTTLGARAIVVLDIDYKCVVQLTQVLNSVEDPAHLVMGIGERSGINLHHARVDLPMVSIERVPRGMPGARSVSLVSAGMMPSAFCFSNQRDP